MLNNSNNIDILQVHQRADECILALNVLTDLDKGVTILNQLGGNYNLKLFKVSML